MHRVTDIWRVAMPTLLMSLCSPALQAAPTINTPVVTPATVTVNQSTLVTASCQINTSAGDRPLLAGGVDLVRAPNAHMAATVVGIMHDDGQNGDVTAGDGIFTLQFTDSEPAAGQFLFQCTAAFKGMLLRVKSPFATVTVGGGTGVIAAPGISPATVPFGIPTPVTVIAAVTGGIPDADSVMLQRLDSSGRVLAVLGSLHDDGLNGDVAANDRIYTLVTTFTEFAIGPISLRVSATFNGSASHVFSPVGTLTVTGTPPPTVTIASPTSLAYLSLSPTTVSGSVSDPTATVVINSISAPVDSSGKFSATVPLAEGPNILTATATSLSGSAGSASITVTLDTTPPHVTITSPMDKFVTTVSSLSVTGNVNDIVVGTVNSQQAQVTVNGVSSQVANRTFLALNVPLNMGSNTIQAVAVDRAGNSATTQITVVRQAPQPGQITLISGNNQTGTIGTSLSAPLVVALSDSSGNPAVNKSVIFAVTQDNGMLAAGNQSRAATVMATTDAQGHATVNWTLGMRSGAGSDAVQAYSVGFSGTALFTATANQGPAGMIVMDSGNNQTGAVNQTLPKPFIAVVVDAGHNRLPNVPVRFTVQQGGGYFAGQPSITVNTDSDGRAVAILTLGFEEGNSNNLVTADFTGDTGFPVSFTASGLGPGDPSQTLISGLVLDNSNQPIPGVTVRAVLTNVLNANPTSVPAAATVQTDANGNFSIYKAPVGYLKLMVDGSTAAAPGTYPSLEFDMVTVAGQINTIGHPINLLPIKTDNQVCVTASTGGGTLTIPEAPGFSLTFGPGQVTFPGGSKNGCVSVTTVHPDKVPMVPGFGQQPRFIVTIQPSGALFDPPAPITLPNVDGLKPREVTEMYSFDHDINSFVAIGTGTVSDDGQVIRSNPGIGVLKAGWHCGGNPNPGGAAATCGPCAYCDGQNCQPNPVQGNGCFGACLIPGTGICNSGYCKGRVNIGLPCGNGGICDQNGNCGFPCVGPNCNGGCGSCNSGDPCISDSCSANNQCVSTPNTLCQTACSGAVTGSCNVNGVLGTCDSSANCNLCQSLGVNALCTCGNGVLGTCGSGGQCQCGTPRIGVTPTDLQLGWSPYKTTGPRYEHFTISNIGGGTLTVSLTMPMTPFSLPGSATLSIVAGQSTQVDVGFEPPLAKALFGDRIDIASNDPSQPTVSIILTGRVFDQQSPDMGRFGQFYYRDCNGLLVGDCKDAGDDEGTTIEIDPLWKADYITTVFLPGCGPAQINTAAVQDFVDVFAIIGADPSLRSKVLNCVGTFVPRYQSAASGALSKHSWGIAIDLNYVNNVTTCLNVPHYFSCQATGTWGSGLPSAENLYLWNNAFLFSQWAWGANFTTPGRQDPMHFELVQ